MTIPLGWWYATMDLGQQCTITAVERIVAYKDVPEVSDC
jgi:hypothetical protein